MTTMTLIREEKFAPFTCELVLENKSETEQITAVLTLKHPSDWAARGLEDFNRIYDRVIRLESLVKKSRAKKVSLENQREAGRLTFALWSAIESYGLKDQTTSIVWKDLKASEKGVIADAFMKWSTEIQEKG